MLDLNEIKDCLAQSNLSKVSRDTRLHYQQVWRLKVGVDKNPTYKILKALSDYFESTK
jgi:hypothetical protein